MTLVRVLGAVLFAGGSLICLGFAVSLAYEAIAYATGLVPTISDITVQEVIAHHRVAPVLFLAAGVIVGALAAHFGDWIP